jgi:uncharacterized protein
LSGPVHAATPRQVFEHVQHLILGGRIEEYADLFSADGTLELPFAPPGIPRRIEGREAIRAFFRAAATKVQAPLQWEFRSVVVHQTANPEVIVTEFDVHGRDPGDGEPYHFSNLQVMAVRQGEIVSIRDYWNPLDRPELMAGMSQIGDRP